MQHWEEQIKRANAFFAEGDIAQAEAGYKLACTEAAKAFETWFDFLPLIGTIIFSASLLCADNRMLIARANFLSNGFWSTYALFSLSYFGILFGIFVAFSTLLGMARHEKWEIGKCYKTFGPSLMRSLFVTPQTYP